MSTDASFQDFLKQLETILILLDRPIVQTQIAAVLAVLVVAWLLASLVRQQIGRLSFYRPSPAAASERQTRRRRLVVALEQLFFPSICLGLLLGAALLLERQGQRAGLLRDTIPIFLVALIYFSVVALLYARFDEEWIRPFHTRVLLPAFIAVLAARIFGNFLNLQALRQLALIQTASEATITVGMLANSLITLYIFFTAAHLMQHALRRAMNRTGNRAAITSILIVSRYAVLGIGIIIAASFLGFDTTTLTFIGGGLSIGVGFGLQQIIANFISGILLLFEQSLRPGDIIDLDGQIGTVKQLSIRSTSILTNDNVEIIIPNERFLTDEVRTYTRDSRLTRVRLPVSVAYRSNPHEVRKLLIETVTHHTLVRETPAPDVHFTRFGTSSLDFEILVWMDDPRRVPRFKSDLYYMIWEALKRHNIEVPFPQQDVHLRSGWEKLARPLSDEDQTQGDNDESKLAAP